MDTYKQFFSKSGLCLNTSVETQPGLEVQDASSGNTWPWSSPDTHAGIQDGKGAILERRQIAGLSIGTFWALVVLLCLIVGGGISGGVVAGIAAQRNDCKRYQHKSGGREFCRWGMLDNNKRHIFDEYRKLDTTFNDKLRIDNR
ncbi:hypothetical protein BHYA_0330g00050 [Botrytis hyacinthi]|uniref:Uncharacterized protein n=1 Tax=Botrytis hyacinthi TaxID=278943 RepID=A0A4Z1GDF1_9HELO|nr:hypothetical protein BHYA_0330g00050 [Botrytis hyacinthi]